MAIWQIGFIMLPKSVGSNTSIDIENEEELWRAFQYSKNFVEFMDSVLPRSSSWSEEIVRWGTESGDRVELVIEGDKVVGGAVRFDLRNLNTDFLGNLSNLLTRCRIILYSEEYGSLDPATQSIEDALKATKQWKSISESGGAFNHLGH